MDLCDLAASVLGVEVARLTTRHSPLTSGHLAIVGLLVGSQEVVVRTGSATATEAAAAEALAIISALGGLPELGVALANDLVDRASARWPWCSRSPATAIWVTGRWPIVWRGSPRSSPSTASFGGHQYDRDPCAATSGTHPHRCSPPE